MMAPSSRGWIHLILGALLTAVAACNDGGTGPASAYPEAAAHRVNPEVLARAYARARETPGIRSLLVQRNGVLISEEYFREAPADSLYQVWSVTKTVVSILTGIALERGYLETLDQTLADFLAPLVDSLPEDKGKISIRDLLTMTCGLEWHELDGGGEYGRWVRSPDMIQYVIDLPWAAAPGETFHYHTGCTHLLSVILAEATGMPTLDFARAYLFEPLGITEAAWWTDERGYHTGGMGLQLRPRDMVKIGELFVDLGAWEGNQIVATAWVREATTTQVITNNAVTFGPEYGYLWWIGHGQGRDFYFANGYAGQFILVSPDLDLVVVTTSDWSGLSWEAAGAQWGGVIDVVVNGVLPAVQP